MSKFALADGILIQTDGVNHRPTSVQHLAVLSCIDDLDASNLLLGNIALDPSTAACLDRRSQQGDEQTDQTIQSKLAMFSKFSIPIGLFRILEKIKAYRLSFLVDDSGSMSEQTDV